MNNPHLDEEPAEHRRFARHLRDLEAVGEADESQPRDTDVTMAESAVGQHLDPRAAQLLTAPAFTHWAHTMAVGRPLPTAEIVVRDADGNPVQHGELWVRGSQVRTSSCSIPA